MKKLALVMSLLVVVVVVVVVLVVGFAGVALAHERVTIGKYELTFGAEDEPKVTDRRTFMVFWVTDTETEQRVTGLEKTLTLTLDKGGVRKELEVGAVYGQPDQYKASVYFTEPGTYVAHIEGTIGEIAAHEHIEFEVEDATQLMLPEVTDISAIAEEVTDARQDAEKAITLANDAHEDAEKAIALAQDVDDKLSTLNWVAIVALILSVIATIGMVFSLVTRRR